MFFAAVRPASPAPAAVQAFADRGPLLARTFLPCPRGRPARLVFSLPLFTPCDEIARNLTRC